jgi:hypothetical protein
VSDRRDKLWYLINDRGGEVAELDIRLDCIDMEIDGLRALRYEETKAKLERLGFDTAKYRPPPQLRSFEQRCTNHVRPDDDVEALIVAAKGSEESALDRVYREHRATAADTVIESPAVPQLHPPVRDRTPGYPRPMPPVEATDRSRRPQVRTARS